MTPIAELDRALDEVTHERGKTRILHIHHTGRLLAHDIDYAVTVELIGESYPDFNNNEPRLILHELHEVTWVTERLTVEFTQWGPLSVYFIRAPIINYGNQY